MTASWAEAKKLHSNTVVGTSIPMRGDLVEEYDRLEDQLALVRDKPESQDATGGPAYKIAKRMADLENEMRESEVRFVFRGLGKGKYAVLLTDHPPTDEQQAQAKQAGQVYRFNPETFPVALMAACCIEPAELQNNVEEFQEIHTDWSDGQVSRLWTTCCVANEGVTETPKSVAASEILGLTSSGNN